MPPSSRAAKPRGGRPSASSRAATARSSRATSARQTRAATSTSSKAQRRSPSRRSTRTTHPPSSPAQAGTPSGLLSTHEPAYRKIKRDPRFRGDDGKGAVVMELPRNTFKHALAAGKPQIGLWSSLSSNYSVELIAGAGFDWLLLDMEHSPNDLESLLAQLQAAAPYATHPVVRVPWNDMVTIKRVLDVGAQTLLVPYVSTADEARAAFSFTRYPPKGVRGVAGTTRATRFGRIKDYARRAHEEICLLVQVETQAALDNIEAICAVEGVDGVFVGPADLHASMGYV